MKCDEPVKNLKILLEKSNTEEEIELIESTKEKIRGLRAELECEQDLIMEEESETSRLF